VITIQPNLRRWLERYPLDKHAIIPPNAFEHRRAIKRKFTLGHDVLRHSFVAYLYSKEHDLGDTARQAGNSADVIRSHYSSYRRPEEVKAFWEIQPKKAGKIIPMEA